MGRQEGNTLSSAGFGPETTRDVIVNLSYPSDHA
jgi:hypothetical protein